MRYECNTISMNKMTFKLEKLLLFIITNRIDLIEGIKGQVTQLWLI